MITNIVINTRVTPSGQYPENIELTLSDPSAACGLCVEDFSFEGKARDEMEKKLHDFSAEITEVIAVGNLLTLYFDSFPEKYINVKDFAVSCERNEDLDFTMNEVDQVVTPDGEEL